MKKAGCTLFIALIVNGIVYAQNTDGNIRATVWLTTADGNKRLEKQGSVNFQIDTGLRSMDVIYIDGNISYQEMDGFGAAMTGTSAYVLNRYLTPGNRDSLMSELFSKKGIHLSFIRQMIGASGYEIGGDFSYDDMPPGKTDTSLRNFSIENDKADVIPVLQMALTKNDQLKIFGSPCSAPGWMKNTGSMRGTGKSYLLHQYYPTYARYFEKYIKAYEAEGIPIYAITIQNEPEFAPDAYPGMIMTSEEQAKFIKNNLGPVFTKEKIATKIIIFDHNWGSYTNNEKGFAYPLDVLDDTAARKYIAGTAFHNYGGSPDLQSFVHDKYPEKGIWFTEGSGGEWVGDFSKTMKEFVSKVIIGSVRNWSKSVCLWNIALDKNNVIQKAKNVADQNCAACYGLVMIDTLGNIIRMPEYYALAHISGFVVPGAKRIASNSFPHSIENVAFKNPDGSKVLLAINNNTKATSFKIIWKNTSLEYSLDQGDVVTLVWE